MPAFFVIGIAFVAIGIGLLHFSNQVLEYSVDYTNCENDQGKMCKDVLKEWLEENKTLVDYAQDPCVCKKEIEVEKDMVCLLEMWSLHSVWFYTYGTV